MDALYVFKHSRHADEEIRYSLRSLARHAPFIRKVWIFGDRPAFLSPDRLKVEHVPHDYIARLFRFQTPITNTFLMTFLGSLIPDMESEFLWMCDDFFLIDDISEADIKKVRYLENLDDVKNRGTGLWKDSLWRTYDLFRRKGYPRLNFETHTPTYMTRKWVFEAYCDLCDFVTEDRFYGLIGPSGILNHALRRERFPLTRVSEENWLAGFHGRKPDAAAVREKCEGKTFLNFDDDAYGESLQQFLQERFPHPSIYEVAETTAESNGAAPLTAGTFVVKNHSDRQ